MIEVHYGVVKQDNCWAIIRQNLRFGAYATGPAPSALLGGSPPGSLSFTSRKRRASCCRRSPSSRGSDRSRPSAEPDGAYGLARQPLSRAARSAAASAASPAATASSAARI
jgi:hypothetical protein